MVSREISLPLSATANRELATENRLPSSGRIVSINSRGLRTFGSLTLFRSLFTLNLASRGFATVHLSRKALVSPTETASNTKREIQVEVPAEEVTRETDTLIQKYQKLARLPGFRRGHVPASIIRQRFAEDLKTDVVEALVPRYFRKETEKQGLIPVSQPRVTDLHLHEGEPLRFKAAFEIMPEIKVEGYMELHAEKPSINITDEEVEQALAELREQHATFSAVEGRP